MLDNGLTCINVILHSREAQCCDDVVSLLRRAQDALGLRTIVMYAPFHVDGLLKYLPDQITTLFIYGDISISPKNSTRLKNLTALHATFGHNVLPEFTCITGLTRLKCGRTVGSVAHLAPTLKRLSIDDCANVWDMDQLTNLEVLAVFSIMPLHFLQRICHLPLEWLILSDKLLMNVSALCVSPLTTLQRLKLRCSRDTSAFSCPLPTTSITHLQLLCADIRKPHPATASPWLRKLDVEFSQPCFKDQNHALNNLTGLTKPAIVEHPCGRM